MSLKGNIEAKQEVKGKINYIGYNDIQEKIAKADAAADAANKAAEAANDVAEKAAPYAERLFEVEKTLDEVIDDGFKSITKDSPEISQTEESVYYDRTGNLEINSNYTTYHIKANEDFEIFFDGLTPFVEHVASGVRCEMLYLNVYDNFWANPSSLRVSGVFSTEEQSEKFPYSVDRKLKVNAGELITVSVAKKDPNNEYSNATIYFDGTKYVDGFLLRYNQDGATYRLSHNVRIDGDAFGPTVKIVGGNKPTDVGRFEVYRDFNTYAASNRKFAAYDYNCFFAKDKLANGKPLAVRTLVWPELQLDAYSRQNVASDLILEDYKANQDKYHYDAEDDCYYRDIFVHYPLKDGQVAIIEKGGVIRAHNFEATESVKAGHIHTDWVIFKNDTPQLPNRMFNDTWQLLQVREIFAGNADTWLKNVHTQSVYTPWVVFDNDGGTAETYNRLYNEWWKLNKLKTIDAPIADASFKSVKVNGEAVATAKDIGNIETALDNIIAIQNSLMGVTE